MGHEPKYVSGEMHSVLSEHAFNRGVLMRYKRQLSQKTGPCLEPPAAGDSYLT